MYCSLFNIHDTDLSNLIIQRKGSLSSLVAQLSNCSQVGLHARHIVSNLIQSPINSKDGIKLSLDAPLNNPISLNIIRPAVLRQYFGNNIDDNSTIENEVKRYTYGSGSGTSSVGMDKYNFVTREMTPSMQMLSSEIHKFLRNNKLLFNLETTDMSQLFNHCSVILYYAGKGLKKLSSLGYHSDCVYSTQNGKFVSNSNSQVINTPTVIYSLGDSRTLNYRKRKLINGNNQRNEWLDDAVYRESFHLDRDTITIVNQLDEDPLSPKNNKEQCQYIHGDVKVSGESLSAGIVLRVVSSVEGYNTNHDTMIVDGNPDDNDIVHGVLGVDLFTFHNDINILLNKTDL